MDESLRFLRGLTGGDTYQPVCMFQRTARRVATDRERTLARSAHRYLSLRLARASVSARTLTPSAYPSHSASTQTRLTAGSKYFFRTAR